MPKLYRGGLEPSNRRTSRQREARTSPWSAWKRPRHPSPAPTGLNGVPRGPIANGAAYLDTIAIRFARRPPDLLAEARRISESKVWFKDVIDPHGIFRGVRFIAHQPPKPLRKLLARYQLEYGGILVRLDIAFDLWPIAMTVKELGNYFRANALLRGRHRGHMFDYEATTYWNYWTDGQPKPEKQLVLYDDLPSKIGVIRPNPVCHPELRFQTAEILKQQGFILATDADGINPRELFDANIRIVPFDQLIRRNILDAEPKDRRRMEGHLKHAFGNHGQLYKDREPNVVKAMPTLNQLFILPDHLTEGARSGARDHLKDMSE